MEATHELSWTTYEDANYVVQGDRASIEALFKTIESVLDHDHVDVVEVAYREIPKT